MGGLPIPPGCAQSYRVLILVVLLITVYFWLLSAKYGKDGVIANDPLNQEVDPRFPGVSWWPISHFLLFFLMGILFPKCDAPILFAGVLWEVIETVIKKVTQSHQGLYSDPERYNSHTEKRQYADSWWAGSLQDIAFNVAGFYAGKFTALYLLKKRVCIDGVNDLSSGC